MVRVGAPSLHHDLQQIGAFQGQLPGPVAVLIGLAAAAAVLMPAAWSTSQHLYTIAHEGGHALMGSAMGRRITSVTMERNGSGLTKSAGPPGFSVFLFQFFGYLAPSALGVGAAKLIEVGHIIAVLWLLLLALAALLVTARGYFAWTCVICAGALLYVVARYAPTGAQVAMAYGVTWFLLISSVAMVLKHWQADGDRALLKSTTHLPKGLWPPLWFIGTVAALLTGAKLLI